MSSMAFGLAVNNREADDLKDRLKLYTQGIYRQSFTMKNFLAKREIAISGRMSNLPITSKTAFGDMRNNNSRDWQVNSNKRGIQYLSVPGTSKRKSVKKIDGKYVVLFYRAVGKNDEMVESTFEDIGKSLERN